MFALTQVLPFQPGQIISSPGGRFKYRIVSPVCRLYDREEMPWPCCRLQWKGKEPSWRRIGRRFVADVSTKRCPSYAIELVGFPDSEPRVMSLFWYRLTPEQQNWWYTKRLSIVELEQQEARAIA